jgi:hypothetical protein
MLNFNGLQRNAQVNAFNVGSSPIIVGEHTIDPGSSRDLFFQNWHADGRGDPAQLVASKRVVGTGDEFAVYDATAMMTIDADGCSIRVKAVLL